MNIRLAVLVHTNANYEIIEKLLRKLRNKSTVFQSYYVLLSKCSVPYYPSNM